MQNRYLLALAIVIGLLGSAISSGLISKGARNVDELFHPVKIEESE